MLPGLYQNAADSLLGATTQTTSLPEDSHQKFSFTIKDLVNLLKMRDWEEVDDTALNFDDPNGQIDRRIAELLDRSDLEGEWRKAQAKKTK